jgi:hypothetical protein
MKVLAADLLGDSKLVRHDPATTAKVIVELAARVRNGKETNLAAVVTEVAG